MRGRKRMSLYACVLYNPRFPRAAPAHLHDKLQTLCSSQGACSWDNPASRRKMKLYGTTHKADRESSVCTSDPDTGHNPHGCSPHLQPPLLQVLETAGAAEVRRALGFPSRGCRLTPSPRPELSVWCSRNTLSAPRPRGSAPLHSRHTQPCSASG